LQRSLLISVGLPLTNRHVTSLCMTRQVFAIAAIGLAAALLWWAVGSQPRQESTSMTPPITETPQNAVPNPPDHPATSPNSPQPSAAVEPTQPSAPAQENAESAAPKYNVPTPRLDGPVAEYKTLFTTEPRDSAAADVESKISAGFRDPHVPPELLKSVMCRESVCKLELRWKAERNTAYMIGMTHLIGQFEHAMAFEPIGVPDANGVLSLDVYLKRLPKPAP
jgi:hypothetical protein